MDSYINPSEIAEHKKTNRKCDVKQDRNIDYLHNIFKLTT